MVAISDTPTPGTVNPNNQEMKPIDSTPKVSSDYEKCREERIKENLERMQKLGIYDLSLKLKSIKPNTRRKNNNHSKTPQRCTSPVLSSVPTRRSSRLQNTPAVSYSEIILSKKGNDDDVDELVRENAKPEVYTEEHEKLLGDTKMEWTLFVDGYGKDGKKIYDQVRGKTCHQCRQKTLGHRTRCSKCDLVQGQFCGDCLYMRYGENVLEANQNPDWICPVCRGICNCSLCRQAKGWVPTGVLYRKISSMGYKSVAHYLIQTRRSDPNSKKNVETNVPVKRSLPFSTEEKPTEIQSSDEPLYENIKQESGQEPKDTNAGTEVDEDENVKQECVQEPKDKNADTEVDEDENVKQESGQEPKDTNADTEVDEDENVKQECGQESKDKNADTEVEEDEYVKQESGQESKDKNADTEVDEDVNMNKDDKESEVHLQLTNLESKDNKRDDDGIKTSVVTPETRPGSRKRRRAVMEPVSGDGTQVDSIVGRLRSQRKCP